MIHVRPSLLRVPAAFMLAFLVSGCVQENTPPAAPQQNTTPVSEDAGLGTIRGLVMDDSQFPLARAQASVLEVDPPVVLTTDESGLFVFNGLPPATYSVAVQLLGYQSAVKSVAVAAGETAQVAFELVSIAVSDVPYYNLLHGEGYFACGGYFLGVLTVGNLNPCPWDMNHRPRYEFQTSQQNLFGIMQEITWEQASALTAERLIVSLAYKTVCAPTCSSAEVYESANAPSPIRLYNDLEGESWEEEPVPLASLTFPGGEGAEIVIVFQQRLDHYITIFYNGHGDLDTFTQLPDG